MSSMHHGLSRYDQLVEVCLKDAGPNAVFPNTFGRLFDANPVQLKNLTHQQLVNIYDSMIEDMRKVENVDGPADAGMTFFGQFVDHDITLDATSALGTRIDPSTIPNVRSPNLDLDCVYGSGPDASPHLYGGGKAGQFLMFGRKDNPLDLARTCPGKALIGDPRNDENVIVAQIQGAFICLHNILMSQIKDDATAKHDVSDCAHMGTDAATWTDYVAPHLTNFQEVRRFLRLHYQYVVWTELLPAFVDQACLDLAMDQDIFGPKAPIMPVEFSGAAYRFGHATTQHAYQLNHADTAKRGLFATLGFEPRPTSANIDCDLFFNMTGGTTQKARPVGPSLGSPLFELPFINEGMTLKDTGVVVPVAQAKKLALRNVLRDRYTYQLMDGQRAAARLGQPVIPPYHTLKDNGITKTPLWFYLLEEAEKNGKGKLTGVGGRIVASVFARLLKLDRTTVIHIKGFKPWSGFGGQPSVLAGMLKFVEDHRGQIHHANDLKCG